MEGIDKARHLHGEQPSRCVRHESDCVSLEVCWLQSCSIAAAMSCWVTELLGSSVPRFLRATFLFHIHSAPHMM